MNTLLLKHTGDLKNYGMLKNFTHKCIYKNHTCGDKVTIYLKISKKIIEKISYKTESCLICQASCSIFSDCVKNKNLNVIVIFCFHLSVQSFLFLISDEAKLCRISKIIR